MHMLLRPLGILTVAVLGCAGLAQARPPHNQALQMRAPVDCAPVVDWIVHFYTARKNGTPYETVLQTIDQQARTGRWSMQGYTDVRDMATAMYTSQLLFLEPADKIPALALSYCLEVYTRRQNGIPQSFYR